MNCGRMEQLTALYVEGDLREVERIQVESHLKICWECRGLAEDLKESQFLFKSIRQDLPDKDTLLRLRERVLADAGRLQNHAGFWRWSFTGRRATLATVALIVAVLGTWSFPSAQELDPVTLREAVIRVPSTPESAFRRTVPGGTPKTAAVIPIRKSLASPGENLPEPSCETFSDRVPGAGLEAGCISVAVGPEADVASPPAQVTIKLLTDDPKVIMYWIVEERGE